MPYVERESLRQRLDRERQLPLEDAAQIARAVAIDPEDSGMLYNTACFYAIQGEANEAIACLEKAVQHGFGVRGWLENDPDFNSLRGDPRFQAILAKM